MKDDKIQAPPARFEPEFYTKLSKKAKSEYRTISAEIERLTVLAFYLEEFMEEHKKEQMKKN